jgi:fucokinase
LHIDGCDYLIVTASNEFQAEIYRKQLDIRRRLGLLAGIDKILVVPDVDGKRIGSGGSTLCCLLAVLREELGAKPFPKNSEHWNQAFANKRVLIIHAGGDSKRLPAYSSCGKLFVPIPGRWDCPIPLTLFDRQLYFYLGLFGKENRSGQFIMTSGDVLLRFKAEPLECGPGAVTGFCCPTSPEQASRHGVFCLEQENKVRLYLQKPTYQQQKEHRALNSYNQAMLDIGIMAFDGGVAAQMLKVFGLRCDSAGKVVFEGKLAKAIIEHGLDFYRELCCVFGSQATKQLHRQSAWGSDSTWPENLLSELFDKASAIGLQAKPLAHCDFLDFGNVKQIISSGYRLAQEEGLAGGHSAGLSINNVIAGQGAVSGSMAWVEGCVVEAPLHLEGNNIVTGIDVKEELTLGPGQCLDVVPGRDNQGHSGWFVRCYGFADDFKSMHKDQPSYCGSSINDWLKAAKLGEADIWDKDTQKDQRSLFNAKLFPFVQEQRQFRDFLWMLDPTRATQSQIKRWKAAERFSHKEIALLTDVELFHQRRQSNRLCDLNDKVSYLFRPQSQFSARKLAIFLNRTAIV